MWSLSVLIHCHPCFFFFFLWVRHKNRQKCKTNVFTQTANRFFSEKCKMLKLYPTTIRFFFREIQDFEDCTQTAICSLTINYKVLKVGSNLFSFFKSEFLKIWIWDIFFRLLTFEKRSTDFWIPNFVFFTMKN